MPRLLSPDEWTKRKSEIDESCVEEFWSRFSSEIDLAHFFYSLAQHCGVADDVAFQGKIARACYPAGTSGLRQIEKIQDQRSQAKQLVKIILKDIKAIHALRQAYACITSQNSLGSDETTRRGLNIEARQVERNLSEFYDELSSHCISAAGTSLNGVLDAVEEVRVNLATSTSSQRFETAVRDLEAVLADWKNILHSKQGVRPLVQELDKLIADLARSYEETTGRPPDESRHFSGFVELAIDQLPFIRIAVSNHADQDRLKKRISAVLRKGAP